MTVLQKNLAYFGRHDWDKRGKNLSSEQKKVIESSGLSLKGWTTITVKRDEELTIGEITAISKIVGIPAHFLIVDPANHKGLTDFAKW